MKVFQVADATDDATFLLTTDAFTEKSIQDRINGIRTDLGDYWQEDDIFIRLGTHDPIWVARLNLDVHKMSRFETKVYLDPSTKITPDTTVAEADKVEKKPETEKYEQPF